MAVLNEALADELQRQGVTRVFTLLGEDVVQLGVQLTQRGIKLVSARHESGAIAMADGYARVSGELAVALISRGPGVTNALTGLENAAKASNPVLVITGDNAPTTRGVIYSKWLDQTALFKAAEIPFVTIDSPDSAVADLAAVTEWVRGGKLMVAQFPGEILEATAGQAPASITLPPPRPVPGPPDPEQITLLADLLGEDWAFAHPVILGGRGAYRAGAKQALQELGDRIGAILATTLMGKGLYDDDPFSVGISGTYSSEAAIELLGMADVVLAFGSSLDPLTTINGSLWSKARVFRFDADPAQADKGSVPAEIFVEADARLAAEALVAELDRRGHKVTGMRNDRVRAQIAEARIPPRHRDIGRPGSLDPRQVMMTLDELLPDERNVVLDNGHHAAFSTAHLRVPDPGAFLTPLEFHCVGASTGMATGAALARPDRMTLFCVGDTGALMTFGDIESIARHRLPVVVVVVDDGGLGAEIQYLRVLGIDDTVAREHTPSFAEVGRGLGFDAYTIETLDDLTALRETIAEPTGPVLLHVRVTEDVKADWVEVVMLGHRSKEPAVA
jgi:acetolactate synthase I/II/III large subunit